MSMPHVAPEPAEAAGQRKAVVKGVSPRMAKKKVALGGGPFAAGAGAFAGFTYHGGRIINTPQVYTVFLGDWTSAANQNRATRLNQFLNDLMHSDYMNMLAQYGCGTSGSVVNSVFIPSTNHNLNRTDIENVFQTAINNSQIPEPTNQSNVYVLFLDDSTGVNGTFGTDHTVMCEASSDDAFGFHFHFNTTAGNELFYAVVPGLTDTCLTNSCPSDSTCSLHLAQTREQRQTQVLSHEFSEMISDPDVEGTEGWTEPSGPHENGDICNGHSGTLTVGSNSWTVQLMYSKYDDQQTNGATTCVLGSSFPLPSLLPACTILLDRSTFGRDEVDAFLSGPTPGPATFDAALYVAVDGFTANQLGITAGDFSGTPSVQPNFTFAPGVTGLSITGTSLSAPDEAALDILQRFTWTCRVTFTSDAGFPASPGSVSTVTVTAGVSSVSGSADLQLIDEPNPYELDGPISWLSTDLRVFQIRAGQTRFNETIGSTPADALTFIQNVLTRLQNGTSGADTFDTISTDENTSVLELSEQLGGVNVYNFGVARVRFRSLSADAHNVRVFFRSFAASTTSTVYDQSTTYRRGGTAGTVVPLLGFVGGQLTTIPFFASPRVDTSTQSMNDQTDPPNFQTLSHDPSGNEVEAYFGCWLDINQASQPQFPISPAAPIDGPYPSGRQTIQNLIRNAHTCLTAEIEMDGVTLVTNGETPGSSDKLAQRNLSIVASDNPGSPASHRIPNTFEIKPTSFATIKENLTPDELLIDWQDIPAGAEASIFLPGTDAQTVLNLANSLYVTHRLSAVDAHTLKTPAHGVTYIPIPAGQGANLAGLLTIDLPSTVRKGQAFKAVARQLTNAVGRQIVPPPPIGSGQRDGALVFVDREPLIRWRKVIGSFQVSMPVRTREVMLEPEERLLAVLKWIDLSIPPTDRWSPVFTRYVQVVADRVKALGGDPDKIQPSPSGNGHVTPGPESHISFTGRIAEVVYDRFGEFEGFVLDTEEGRRSFSSEEEELGGLVRDAWEDRLLVRIVVERDSQHKPHSLVLLRAPRGLHE